MSGSGSVTIIEKVEEIKTFYGGANAGHATLTHWSDGTVEVGGKRGRQVQVYINLKADDPKPPIWNTAMVVELAGKIISAIVTPDGNYHGPVDGPMWTLGSDARILHEGDFTSETIPPLDTVMGGSVPAFVKWYEGGSTPERRPKNWSNTGAMDSFQGKVIVVSEIGGNIRGPIYGPTNRAYPGWKWDMEDIIPNPSPEQVREFRELHAEAGGAPLELSQAEKEHEREIMGSSIGYEQTNLMDSKAAIVEIQDGVNHKRFPVLLALLKAGQHVFMSGPAGSGKTYAAEKAAEALGLEFYCQSVGGQTSMSHLLGYMDATGNYRGTMFRKAFEKGGVFLLDEIDAGNANVMTCLNAALANAVCSFPDGMIHRHPASLFLAAGNTWGEGADRKYVGRNALDAATLDRFAFIEWGYDEVMERKAAGDDEWVKNVQCIREAVKTLDLKIVVTPRASIEGARLIKAGFTWKQAEEHRIWKGVPPDLKNKVKQEAAKQKMKSPASPPPSGSGSGPKQKDGSGSGQESQQENMMRADMKKQMQKYADTMAVKNKQVKDPLDPGKASPDEFKLKTAPSFLDALRVK